MPANQQSIRIGDLRKPVLTDAMRRTIDDAARNPVDLTEDAVLSSARQLTGLTDFGPDTFRAGLRSQLAGTTGTPLDRAEMFRSVVRNLVIRLRFYDLLGRHPEILDRKIEKPIIIVGPSRSGTTYLQGTLAADSRLRSLRLREAAEPFLPAGGAPAAKGGVMWSVSDDGQNKSSIVLPGVRTDLLPHLASILQLGPDDVAQENMLMDSNFPIDDEDQAPHYAYLATMLKALQWQRGPDRWVLKAPMHCEYIPLLLANFPDATFVMTHRDPVAMVQSLATMFAYAARLRSSEVDVEAIFAAAADRIEGMLRARMRDRSLIADDHVVDVLFHEFTADQLSAVREIYDAAGLTVTDELSENIAAFNAEHRRYRRQRIVHDLRADFGVEPEELRERFDFYYQRHPVRFEVR
ncbi:sulfotransferase [Amycolatopsis rhizosphaerae]|uniref:Sulfotransferase n=1 Tax=Amycolatopsis rhizosphaerae TaxID=2053003 RepID=A0A558B714_9PSEU|nr:sulfotransferase [Amycolatopsis rhizosphaerae]TVT32298.1 sulfotransferase [Amycolatopsis rhizosphaerae]